MFKILLFTLFFLITSFSQEKQYPAAIAITPTRGKMINENNIIKLNKDGTPYVKRDKIEPKKVLKKYNQEGNLYLERTLQVINGKMQVSEKYYYPSGQLQLEQPFNGVGKHYRKNGQVNKETLFKNGKPISILERFFYGTGELRLEILKNSQYKKEGISKWYYKSGVLLKEVLYRNDKREGLEREYYPSGKLAAERNYHNNQMNGMVKYYNEEGKLNGESSYKDGKKHGVSQWYVYNKEGIREISSKKTYNNGMITP